MFKALASSHDKEAAPPRTPETIKTRPVTLNPQAQAS